MLRRLRFANDGILHATTASMSPCEGIGGALLTRRAVEPIKVMCCLLMDSRVMRQVLRCVVKVATDTLHASH